MTREIVKNTGVAITYTFLITCYLFLHGPWVRLTYGATQCKPDGNPMHVHCTINVMSFIRSEDLHRVSSPSHLHRVEPVVNRVVRPSKVKCTNWWISETLWNDFLTFHLRHHWRIMLRWECASFAMCRFNAHRDIRPVLTGLVTSDR